MSANTPDSKVDFKHHLQRSRLGFEQQTMSGKVVTPTNCLIAKYTAIKAVVSQKL